MSLQAIRDWEPAKTWVFIVGTLRWADAESFAPFDPKARRDQALADFFHGQGVPRQQIVLLQDDAATAAAIDHQLSQVLAQTSPGDLLIVYYCGHGYRLEDGAGYFASYDASEAVPGWSMDTLPAMIGASFSGDNVLLLADCCCGGCLTAAISAQKGLIGWAALVSSAANESSTEAWTFTDSVLSGLRGESWTEMERDGRLTVAELAAQVRADMAFAEEQQACFVTMGTFDPDFVLAPARRKTHPRLGERVEVRADGEWYKAQIIGVEDDQFRVHFFGYDADEDATVAAKDVRALPESPYQVGEAIEVRWKGEWFGATVQAINARSHLIHYTDYDPIWDEWVSTRRMRRTE